MKRPHEKLKVWQLSVALVSRLYTLTGKFPDAERYGLISQIRRSGVSIPANIAEGAARGSDAEYLRFLRISRGSLSELETLLLIAKNLCFIKDPDYFSLLDECEAIGSLIEGLARRLKASLISEEDPAYEA